MDHSPGFLQLVAKTKQRIRETTPEEVRLLLERASLPYDRIVEAVRIDTEKQDEGEEKR